MLVVLLAASPALRVATTAALRLKPQVAAPATPRVEWTDGPATRGRGAGPPHRRRARLVGSRLQAAMNLNGPSHQPERLEEVLGVAIAGKGDGIKPDE